MVQAGRLMRHAGGRRSLRLGAACSTLAANLPGRALRAGLPTAARHPCACKAARCGAPNTSRLVLLMRRSPMP